MTKRINFELCIRALIVGLLVFGSVTSVARPATAATVLIAAAENANKGLSACNSNTGKALYDCVANVLDRMSNEIGSVNAYSTSSALQTAAAGLRSASNKSQALSAIATCRAAISGALQQIKAAGGSEVRGWGDSGLSAIAAVLARASQLIQTKG